MLRLPDECRDRFKKPIGRLLPELVDALPLLAGRTVYTVGDVVTQNLLAAGGSPDVAVIDGYTMRAPCARTPLCAHRRVQVKNPAGTLTEELVRVLEDAVEHPPVLIIVDGEEDLAVVPLVRLAPEGSVILYGQPGEGLVVCTVTEDLKTLAKDLYSLFVPVETGV
ncbi:GTP-dependent dephospho-CoA kinase family protein [uncultured Methanofollis sp.]|uniref:GTP-dependent dephospho-CoA kinase family protein n=1 Tax=uncultured Methanofollis sp. TaxID=262500 RepID=UPI002637B205|nr:GTP-dependent dephospho-CoA kinase family protein [uncultured Methanofollis sp.]